MQVIPASCPQCGTQYQLTPEHLAVANGKVRCGVCNTIFQAAPPAPTTPAASPASKPADAKSQFVNEDDDLLLQDDEADASLANMDEDFIQDHPEEKDDFNDGFLDKTLGSMDDEDMSNEPSFGQKSGLAGESDDEDWVNQLLSDEGLDVDEVIKKDEPRKEDKRSQPRQALGSSSDDFDFDFEGLDDSSLSLSKDEQAAYGFGEETAKEEMIRNIKPEPLVFQVLNTRSLLSTAGLSIMGVLAVCGIVLQLFFFQKDTLSRDPAWHSLYQTACGVLGCNLPEQYAIADIQATNLTVKSHPHYRDALMVDAIIVNHADIMQPFPNIELFFTDTSNNVVAARQFKPEEYLRGELADASLMPNQQSIHIALEINDPGTSATGYYINLSY